MTTSLYLPVLVFFLLVDGQVLSSTDLHPEPITYILKSYADAFTTPKNYPTYPPTTLPPSTQRIDSSNNVYSYPTLRPDDHYVAATELNSDNSNIVHSYDEEADDHQEPPDHIIPYSEHENPKEPPTRPNYTAPGAWAKPPPDKNISLDFVPTKLYAQVRGTHSVKHVPREEAIKSAETDEEKANAARLKEVVKITKANTIYSEEGYEDAAYDHAGQIRDANFHEGFAKKLNENIDLKGEGTIKRQRKGKKRPRKGKLRNYNHFDLYKDHEENEARISQQQVEPDDLKVLKTALNHTNGIPKVVALDGIRELENDLKKEAEEIQRTSTEPYTSTSSMPSTVKSISRTDHYDTTEVATEISKIGSDTTTPKRDVFTIRPKKTTTPWPNIYPRKIKKPSRYYGLSKDRPNYNSITGGSYGDKPTTTTTASYEELLRQYVLNNPNLTPSVTYRPAEQSTASSNPLAFATVNGHGPYLVVVTSPANLIPSSSYEPLSSGASHYYTITPENRTNLRYNTIIESKNRKVQISGDAASHSYDDEDDDDDEEVEKPKAGDPEFAKFDASFRNYEREKPKKVKGDGEDDDDFTFMQPPKKSQPDPFFEELDYPRRPSDSNDERWTDDNDRPVESTYSVVENGADEGPVLVKPKPQKSPPLPVTRLLPPSPLSASEYTSFQIRDRKSEIPLPPTVVAIIEAIHKKETKPMFPFLFRRRKRSALGPSREWEIIQRDKRLRASQSKINDRVDHPQSERDPGFKRPSDFKVLLEESPKVALDVVNEEIKQRFKDDSKEGSTEASTDESSDNSEDAYTNLNEKNEENEEPDEKVKVEVSLPELDFSSTFEGDDEEDDHTVAKPTGVDRQKYPFYKNDAVLSTALEYVVNPSLVPRKTLGGMEFYNSRSRECEDIEPNLEKLVPENEELESKRGPRKGKLRLRGLGDKLDCFKAKYFGENPLDNPLFYEKEVKTPPLPDELDPKKFASRISKMPSDKDEYVIPKGPKSPETLTRREKLLRNGKKQYIYRPSSHSTEMPPKRKSNSSNKQKGRRPSNSYKMSNSGRVIPEEITQKPKPKRINSLPAYQTEVYQDVMGTILNLEKSKRYPSSKHKYSPSHMRVREKNREKGSYSHNKQRPVDIDGMSPPPRRNRKNKPPKNKYIYSDERNNYYDSNESSYPISRLYKRSISVDDTQNPEQLLAEWDDIKKEKSSFRVIYTTPIPNNSTKLTNFTTEKSITLNPTLYSTQKNTKSSTQDLEKFDKFSDDENVTSTYDYRRNEPRYNRRQNASNKTANATFHLENKPLKVIVKDTTDFGSTFIPVIVKPDELTKTKLLEEIKQAKNDDLDPEEKELDDDKFGESKKTNNFFKNSRKRYSVTTPDDPEEEKLASSTDAYTAETPIDEHKELTDFLKGDPPGYAKAFPDETNSYYDEVKPKELLQKEESKVSKSYEKKDQSVEDGSSKEDSKSVEETSRESNNSGEASSENNDSKEAAESEKNEKKSSGESNDEPFERYTDRPYSPPENYEDDRYSDLGPRINKPYFYHPPFEIPEYEKIKNNNNADQNTSEETEDHETYVYPWEKEDRHDENESKSYETTNAYEYPWDKKEKKEKRESSKEKYDSYDSKPEENSEEATNTRPIYIPLGDKHVRGKKDVTKDEVNPENDATSKFSSKYKSDAIEVPATDKETSSSTESYLKDSIVSWPARVTQKSISNDTSSVSSDLNSNDGSPLNTSSIPPISTTPSSLRFGRTKMSATSSTTKLDPRLRLRGSKDFLNRYGNNARLTSQTRSLTSTSPATFTRRRGRVRNSSNESSPSTTVYSTLPSVRRRTRPTLTAASSTVPTFSGERRRRPFRVQSTSNNTPTSTVRTVAHHSRVSKQEIFTRTTYPDEDDEEDSVPEENSTNSYTKKPTTNPVELAKVRRGRKPANDSQDPKKKKKIEKVVITMEKTPDHVYETKEVDRDGVKGKFVTITANNNSDTTSGDEDDLHMHDAEIEEMNRRRSADNSFSNMMRDTEDLVDKSSGVDVSLPVN